MKATTFKFEMPGARWTLPASAAATAPAQRFRVLRSGAVASPDCHPVEVLCWDDFLPEATRDALFASVSGEGDSTYDRSMVVRGPDGPGDIDEAHRRSLVLHSRDVREVLLPLLAAPQRVALERAGYGHVPLGTTEVQVTASGDGDRFGVHTDDGCVGGRQFLRLVTFVYYLHRRPRPFAGGALRVYDSRLVDDGWGPAPTWTDVEPVDNRLVMFLSDRFHEVLRVETASARFEDRRFTVNGWFSSERDLQELAASGALG